jgi:hypothetical protein
MTVKMIQTGKFALDGMSVTTYPKGEVLGDETPNKVKAYFLLMDHAVSVGSERKPVEEKIERPVVAPAEKKVIKPEVKKYNKGNKKNK